MKANYNLQAYNTLAVPVECRWFEQVQSVDELQTVLDFAQRHSSEVLPLGEGSNIVFADSFSGVVIQSTLRGVEIVEESEDSVFLKVGAGENWHRLVEFCLKKGWFGIENLALIPGSVGAAPVQNIGAYGIELKDVFHSLVFAHIGAGSTKEIILTREQCQFAYRDSIFKQGLENKAMIFSVQLKLSKTPKVNVQYPAVADWIKAAGCSVTPQSVFNAVCALRRSKLPDPSDIPNAGSFFKNPVVSLDVYESIASRFNDVPHYSAGEGQIKLAAGWMIEKAGWKGRGCETTGMHRDQALVLVNPAKASGATVLKVANAVADSVEEMFAVCLEIEPRVY